MELVDCILGRRSVRKYLDKEVEEEKIKEILELAIWAPNSGNTQTWRFIVVKNKEVKEKLAKAAYSQEFIAEAPLAIVVCYDKQEMYYYYGKRGIELYAIQDTAAAIQNMLLAAYNLGLGSCWVGAFDEEAVAKILKLPKSYRPVAIVTIGYPAEKPVSKRKPLSKVVRFVE